jgi:hypothetical protein
MKNLFVSCALAALASHALAAGYDEKKSGDLSGDGLAPTAVKLAPGANRVRGTDGTPAHPDGSPTDRDYFKIHIAPGETLEALIVEPGTEVGGNLSFIGVQAGKKVTVDPIGGSPEDLLGWAHYGLADIGTDILPAIGEGAGAMGFKPPLGPGHYSFWLQELLQCKCHYRFSFVVGTGTGRRELTLPRSGAPHAPSAP